jgi:hypothetical protein
MPRFRDVVLIDGDTEIGGAAQPRASLNAFAAEGHDIYKSR